MNKVQRKEVARIVAELSRYTDIETWTLENKKERVESIHGIASEVSSVQEEEQEKFDNLPEAFQNGSGGEAMTAAIDSLESAASDLDSLDSESQDIDGIVTQIESAVYSLEEI